MAENSLLDRAEAIEVCLMPLVSKFDLQVGSVDHLLMHMGPSSQIRYATLIVKCQIVKNQVIK